MAGAGDIQLSDLYVAYRKAKAEAFYETTHFHAIAFTRYEQALHKNLVHLHRRITSKHADWMEDPEFIGDYAYLPKSVDAGAWEAEESGHFRALDPFADWERRHTRARTKANGALRLIMRPTVDFQVVAALWILKVGYKFDGCLDTQVAFANRVRTVRELGGAHGREANHQALGLFAPYFSAYREWREQGLAAIEQALGHGKSILAITMDIEQFYHRVCPRFLLRREFLDLLGLELSPEEKRLTRQLLAAIETWYEQTPDFAIREEGAIPVGLSASKIISNVLLVEFDRRVRNELRPVHYGRYVDDVFLVLEAKDSDEDADSVVARIATALGPLARMRRNLDSPPSLHLRLPYARDSKLTFVGKKQKVFALSSAHGEDLVRHIRDQIRQQSSEYRMLPALPRTAMEMASRALLATPDASLQVDALRKADVVSVRRLGFALLLSDIETYADDISASGWRDVRFEFYSLARRHVLTPQGFFNFFGYIHRVFGLMLACNDHDQAKDLIDQLVRVAELLRRTTTLGAVENRKKLDSCLEHYSAALLQSGIQAATARTVDPSIDLLRVLRRLRRVSPRVQVPSSLVVLQRLARQTLLADWGRRPYKDFWYLDQRSDEVGPPVPRQIAIRRQLRLAAIRRIRQRATTLPVPHWPAIAFPTRPLRVDEIALVAPDVLASSVLLKDAISVFRGARVRAKTPFGYIERPPEVGVSEFLMPGTRSKPVRVAVTSVHTTDEQWGAAAKGRSDRSLPRYERFNGLINRIIRENPRPDYIVLPELSVPLKWAIRAARKLATNGVSLLAGVEYRRDRRGRLRNDCFVSLTTWWPGYASSVAVLQPKFFPAHGERAGLKKMLGARGVLLEPSGHLANPTVYRHRDFFFSILICSDLTNIKNRNVLRGEVDAVFALEWNMDTETFASLVEATASDMHAFVVQVNNRAYGDSRIRAPAKKNFNRDVVQVKGGLSDYYVVGELDVAQLRREQRRKSTDPWFKPKPIGYSMSASRRRA
jgi:hypothetical protein